MMRRDYILRMIEEFARALSRINALKKGQKWQEAAGTVDEEFQRLVGAGPDGVAKMTETELLGRIVQGEATQSVRDKTLILTTLLHEAGDVAVAQDRIEATVFRRPNNWSPACVNHRNEDLPLESMDLVLPLSLIYEGVTFEARGWGPNRAQSGKPTLARCAVNIVSHSAST